jgi:hypothetical protein
MSKMSFLLWSVVLSLPLQYVFILVPLLYEFLTVGVSHSGGTGEFGCTNFHETGLFSCSLGAMLANPIQGIVVFNALSYGLVSLIFAGIGAALLAVGRSALRRMSTGKG